jgi:hypothetical protein
VGTSASTLFVDSADLNGDGYPDVVYALDEGIVGVALSSSVQAGTFPSSYGPIGGPTGAASTPVALCGDLDGDGHADVVAAGFGQQPVLMRGLGDGTFATPIALSTDVPGGIVGSLGDLNGDGHPDIAVMTPDGGTVWTLINNADSSFTPYSFSDYDVGDNNLSNIGVTLSDLNGDGLDDLLVTTHDTNVYVRISTSTPGAYLAQTIPMSSYTYDCGQTAVADVDNDGKMDIIAGCWDLVVLKGDGLGNFSFLMSDGTGCDHALRPLLGDFNEDGYVDVAVTDYACGTVFINQQTSTPYVHDQWYRYTAGGNARRGVMNDFNADGHPDFALNTGHTLEIYIGQGDGSFNAAQSYPTSGAYSICTADFDEDGKPDLVRATDNEGLVFYPNIGCRANLTY